MGMNKTIYNVSTTLIVILFAVSGMVKISPALYPPAHEELRREFGEFVQVPPVNLLRLQPATYMLIVGVIEVICAGFIALGKYRLGKLGTWVLLVVMLGAVYTHYSVGHPLSQSVPAFVALSLILARLYSMNAFNEVEVKIKI